MANEQNLVSLATRTERERKEIARKGQKASTEAKKEKATMKKTLEILLDEKNKKGGKTYRELATLGLLQGAIKGNAQNYKTILEIIGEVPQEQFNESKEPILNITINNDDKIKEAFYEKEEQE